MKAQVLDLLGETGLGLPGKLNAALAANDRLKYYLSLLQFAAAHARNPNENMATLQRERIAAGVEDSTLDNAIPQAVEEGGGFHIQGCASLLRRIAQDLRVMTEPVNDRFGGRLEIALSGMPAPGDDLLRAEDIDRLTQAGPDESLHRFVMDVHKALNALQREVSEKRIDGASVYGLQKSDLPLIGAFMAGVNRTAPLKFNHPGLETTAARSGARLTIQNDIGVTDAHVIVIHIEGRSVELIYADVHPERIEFLKQILDRFAVSWGEERAMRADSLAKGEPFQLATGRYEAKDSADLRSYLEFLGSKVVFLIDWNRARKQLRGFLRSKQRNELLAWAAEQEIGHRAFLELGGARLINSAIEETAGSAMHFGDRLCDVLGGEAAAEFLRFVFRTAADGLRQQQSRMLIQDRIGAELQAHFSSQEKRLFGLACDHAGLVLEIASLVRDGIREIASGGNPGNRHQASRRARNYEHEADQLLISALEATRKRPEYASLFRLIEAADDAADELEEVAFLLGLLEESGVAGEPLAALAGLAELLVLSVQEWVKALHHAARLERRTQVTAQSDAGDFLTAADRVFALEHQADDAERALTSAAVQHASDFRQLHVYAEMGRSLEAAADALKAAGVIARDYLLGGVLRA